MHVPQHHCDSLSTNSLRASSYSCRPDYPQTRATAVSPSPLGRLPSGPLPGCLSYSLAPAFTTPLRMLLYLTTRKVTPFRPICGPRRAPSPRALDLPSQPHRRYSPHSGRDPTLHHWPPLPRVDPLLNSSPSQYRVTSLISFPFSPPPFSSYPHVPHLPLPTPSPGPPRTTSRHSRDGSPRALDLSPPTAALHFGPGPHLSSTLPPLSPNPPHITTRHTRPLRPSPDSTVTISTLLTTPPDTHPPDRAQFNLSPPTSLPTHTCSSPPPLEPSISPSPPPAQSSLSPRHTRFRSSTIARSSYPSPGNLPMPPPPPNSPHLRPSESTRLVGLPPLGHAPGSQTLFPVTTTAFALPPISPLHRPAMRVPSPVRRPPGQVRGHPDPLHPTLRSPPRPPPNRPGTGPSPPLDLAATTCPTRRSPPDHPTGATVSPRNPSVPRTPSPEPDQPPAWLLPLSTRGGIPALSPHSLRLRVSPRPVAPRARSSNAPSPLPPRLNPGLSCSDISSSIPPPSSRPPVSPPHRTTAPDHSPPRTRSSPALPITMSHPPVHTLAIPAITNRVRPLLRRPPPPTDLLRVSSLRHASLSPSLHYLFRRSVFLSSHLRPDYALRGTFSPPARRSVSPCEATPHARPPPRLQSQ
ncbi:hypothetical protein WJX77_009308 [Trebouxia sp. C0004]